MVGCTLFKKKKIYDVIFFILINGDRKFFYKKVHSFAVKITKNADISACDHR